MMIIGICAAVWLVVLLFAWSLCWAAKRGDEGCASHWRNGPS
jgi:hypothetical protein